MLGKEVIMNMLGLSPCSARQTNKIICCSTRTKILRSVYYFLDVQCLLLRSILNQLKLSVYLHWSRARVACHVPVSMTILLMFV